MGGSSGTVRSRSGALTASSSAPYRIAPRCHAPTTRDRPMTAVGPRCADHARRLRSTRRRALHRPRSRRSPSQQSHAAADRTYARSIPPHRRALRRTYPLLRRPAAMPLIVMWRAGFTSLPALPLRWRRSNSELEVVQRIEIREAVADAAAELRIVLEEAALPGDREEGLLRAPELVVDPREDGVSAAPCPRPGWHSARRSRCRSSRAPCPCCRAGSGRRATRDTSAGATPRPASSSSRKNAATADPKPYQPGMHRAALTPSEDPGDCAQVLDRAPTPCATPAGCRC